MKVRLYWLAMMTALPHCSGAPDGELAPPEEGRSAASTCTWSTEVVAREVRMPASHWWHSSATAISMDASGKLHAAFASVVPPPGQYEGNHVYYVTNVGGGWPSRLESALTRKPPFLKGASEVAMAHAPDDTVYLASTRPSGSVSVLRKTTSGDWEDTGIFQQVGLPGNASHPKLLVTPDGVVHLLVTTGTCDIPNYFRRSEQGAWTRTPVWGMQFSQGDTVCRADMVVDESNHVHVVAAGAKYAHHHVLAPSATSFTTGAHNGAPRPGIPGLAPKVVTAGAATALLMEHGLRGAVRTPDGTLHRLLARHDDGKGLVHVRGTEVNTIDRGGLPYASKAAGKSTTASVGPDGKLRVIYHASYDSTVRLATYNCSP